MFVFKAFTLCALMYITCSEQAGSGSIDQGTLNASVADYLVTLPMQAMKELVDISDKSKGLYLLWRNSLYLTKNKLLKDEVSVLLLCMHVYEDMLSLNVYWYNNSIAMLIVM